MHWKIRVCEFDVRRWHAQRDLNSLKQLTVKEEFVDG